MPPAAISRSSTYFPKSWGNIGSANRSALWAILLLCGCEPAPEPDRVLEVKAHLSHDDAVTLDADAKKQLQFSIEALGDFEATTKTSDTAPGAARSASLAFPVATRAVSATVSGHNASWVALGDAGLNGNIDLFLWHARDATPLWPWHDQNGNPLAAQAYPGAATGVAFGYLPRRHLALFAGSTAGEAQALALDTATGSIDQVDGLARAYASVTAFGDDALLVAGGVDGSTYKYDAEIFDAKTERFSQSPLLFQTPRAHHGAIVLASGETLLVGGSSGGPPLASLEAISPKTKQVRSAGTLQFARENPVVLLLADSRVFVGGGDDGTDPVDALEWLAADGTPAAVQTHVRTARAHAFAAMPGGGVLAVGLCLETAAGICDSSTLTRKVAWIPQTDVAPDYQLADLDVTPDTVWLVPASDGAPWLVASVGGVAVYRRFDPWTRVFDVPDTVPTSGPQSGSAAPLAIDPGAFLWLEESAFGPQISGFRFDTRGTYARDVAPLLLSGADHVAPNRPPLGLDKGIEYTSTGLGISGTDALAYVTDTTYADFTATLTVSSDTPPVIVVGGTRLGEGTCPWPPGGSNSFLAVRRGSDAFLEHDGERTHCKVPSGRVALALSSPGAPTRVRSLTIRRD